ncbi:MAG TPA: HD domain-containing phosphohydrolase, partial [Albitalea sp.]|jgi:hypothetical protein|nr:HD domain-containing phosphohydrolase [Albitalea sp.]
MLSHPVIGEGLLMTLGSLSGAGRVLRHVNENYEGGGTPDRLQGTAIPLASRVLRVAADFEHYKAGAIESTSLSEEQALRRLRQYKGLRYDPMVVDTLLQTFEAPVTAPASRKLLPTSSLRPGMRLADDLVAPSGALLLARDQALDAALIGHIRRVEDLCGAFLWIVVEGE